MPLYEYRCKACGETMEVLQRLADAPPAACPRCGGALVKLLSAPALQFKGSGWYVTDYGKGNGRRSGSESTGEKSGSAGESAAPAAQSKPSSETSS